MVSFVVKVLHDHANDILNARSIDDFRWGAGKCKKILYETDLFYFSVIGVEYIFSRANCLVWITNMLLVRSNQQ